jgi:hypothetical protein
VFRVKDAIIFGSGLYGRPPPPQPAALESAQSIAKSIIFICRAAAHTLGAEKKRSLL